MPEFPDWKPLWASFMLSLPKKDTQSTDQHVHKGWPELANDAVPPGTHLTLRGPSVYFGNCINFWILFWDECRVCFSMRIYKSIFQQILVNAWHLGEKELH